MSPLEVIDGVPARPCVGCGYCCKKAICAEGFIAMGRPQNVILRDLECSYLFWNGDRYRCKLAADEVKAGSIGIGLGCCSSLNTERRKYL